MPLFLFIWSFPEHSFWSIFLQYIHPSPFAEASHNFSLLLVCSLGKTSTECQAHWTWACLTAGHRTNMSYAAPMSYAIPEWAALGKIFDTGLYTLSLSYLRQLVLHGTHPAKTELWPGWYSIRLNGTNSFHRRAVSTYFTRSSNQCTNNAYSKAAKSYSA